MKTAKRRKQAQRMDLDALLAQLEGTQLLRRAQDAELAYLFKHVLTQETAYQSLLVKRRREIHRRVAECYEQVYADELDEYAAMLAQHYAEAGDDAKTLAYATRAGDRAAQVYANAEALMHYDTALDAARRMDASAERLIHLYTRRGRVLELSGRYAEALATYEEMEALARERGDRAIELASLTARTTIHSAPTAVHDRERGQALAERALVLAHALNDRAAEAKIYWNLMWLNSVPGQFRQAIEYGERSLALARELNLREQLAYTLNDLSGVYASVGEIQLSQQVLAEARELWRELGNLPMLADNLNSSVFVLYYRGEYEQVIQRSDEVLRISESIGNLWNQSYGRMLLSFVYLEYGEIDKAVQFMGECLRLGEQAGFVAPQVFMRVGLALAYGMLGALDRAFEEAQLALAKAEGPLAGERPGVMAVLGYLYVLKGNLAAAEAAIEESRASVNLEEFSDPTPTFYLLADGELGLAQHDYARVVQLAGKYLAIFRKFGVRPFVSDALYLKGRALLGQGQVEVAHQVLQEARAEAQALTSRRILWEILASLSQIEAKRGNVAEAEDLRRQAQEIVAYIADHARSPELRASFLSQPHVRAVLSTDVLSTDSGNGLNG